MKKRIEIAVFDNIIQYLYFKKLSSISLFRLCQLIPRRQALVGHCWCLRAMDSPMVVELTEKRQLWKDLRCYIRRDELEEDLSGCAHAPSWYPWRRDVILARHGLAFQDGPEAWVAEADRSNTWGFRPLDGLASRTSGVESCQRQSFRYDRGKESSHMPSRKELCLGPKSLRKRLTTFCQAFQEPHRAACQQKYSIFLFFRCSIVFSDNL